MLLNIYTKLIRPTPFNIADNRFLIILSVVLGIITGFCAVHPTKILIGIPAAMFFFLLILLVAPTFSKDSNEKKILLYLALGAFSIRTIVAFILVSISLYLIKDPVGGYSFANDAYRYLNSAFNIIEYIEQGNNALYLLADRSDWFKVTHISNYFPWISLLITLIFGSYSTLIAGSIYSSFMASLAVIMIYKIGKELMPEDDKSHALDAAIIAIFYPSFIIFTSVMLKEATVIFLSYSLIYIFHRFIKTKQPLYMAIFCIGLVILTTLRVYGAGIVIFAVTLSYIISTVKLENPSQTIKTLLIVSVIIGIVLILGRDIFRFDFIMNVLDLENIQDLRQENYGAAKSYFEIGDLTTPLGILKALPIGLSYILLAPFPWQWFTGDDIVEKALAPDMIIYYILLPNALIGLWHTIKTRSLIGISLIVYMLALALPYSILIGNFGTIYRLRTQLLPCLFIFAALGGTPLVRWCYAICKRIYMNVTKLPVKDSVFDK